MDNILAGETIPIRLFLGGFDLTPTFREVNKKFSVRYYLNLVLIDEENRRYFKQQEITIFRVPEVSATFMCRINDAHVATELMWMVCSVPVFMFFLFHGSYYVGIV